MIPIGAAMVIFALCQFVSHIFNENIKQFRYMLDDENALLSEQDRQRYEKKIKKSKCCCYIFSAVSTVYIFLVCGMCFYDLIKH